MSQDGRRLSFHEVTVGANSKARVTRADPQEGFHTQRGPSVLASTPDTPPGASAAARPLLPYCPIGAEAATTVARGGGAGAAGR